MGTLHFVEDRPGAIALAGQLTADYVGIVRETLLACIEDGVSLEVDLSGVTAIDDQGAELLVQLHHASLMAQKPLTLLGFNATVSATLSGLHVGRALGASFSCAWS
jgi:anti-anti-sigma regulatory factor